MLLHTESVSAAQPSLKIQPLEYREFLESGEKKKGFIDISNPTHETQQVKVDTQAFKQINDKGELSFYDSDIVRAGIKTDYESFKLAPRQVLRMVFIVDGTKLPEGNIFATIFFTTQPTDASDSGQQVRVGTILALTNKTPPSQHVAVTKLDFTPLQLGDRVEGDITVKNTGNPKKETGVYPKLKLQIDPLFESNFSFEGPLVFPGISRQKSFSLQSNRLGIYRLSVLDRTGNILASRWFFAATGWTRPALLGALFLVFAYVIYRYNNATPAKKSFAQKVRKKKITSKE